ncbi:MAG: DNA mismatch repair endonuclease MutL [Pantoea sp. Brub]|nr:DNA mismatch repair endonuclease MutL [Pantoea sp. Brub]
MSIKILSAKLINQIAAGEIIERPVSVVKELIENSLDAGANYIDIHIKKGGTKLIQVQDNGYGIVKDELNLALARYATSKITCINDLEAIKSFGFRGEALSSICSVSRLTLTSRSYDQQQAWQIYSEGLQVILKPANHPIGTTVKILDLFYNMPARRKFMKTEKTEFIYIDSLIREMSLSRFDITFSLSHNDKLIFCHKAARNDNEKDKRLIAICGTNFQKNALSVDYRSNDLVLCGWITNPYVILNRSRNIQYCYINKRIIYNKIINHGIKQALYAYTHSQYNKNISYVLYLEIDPSQIDINIHPAKHEIRFYQSKLIHNFIFQGIQNVLNWNQNRKFNLCTENVINLKNSNLLNQSHTNMSSTHDKYNTKIVLNDYAYLNNHHNSNNLEKQVYQDLFVAYKYRFGQVLTVLQNHYALIEKDQKLILIYLPTALSCIKQIQFKNNNIKFNSQSLLNSVTFKIKNNEYEVLQRYNKLLLNIGINIRLKQHEIILISVPLVLHNSNLDVLFPKLLSYLAKDQNCSIEQLIDWLSKNENTDFLKWNSKEASILLSELEFLSPEIFKSPPKNLLVYINIDTLINKLHEVY